MLSGIIVAGNATFSVFELILIQGQAKRIVNRTYVLEKPNQDRMI
jgi:hypothetical protein